VRSFRARRGHRARETQFKYSSGDGGGKEGGNSNPARLQNKHLRRKKNEKKREEGLIGVF